MAEEYNIPWKIEGEFVVTGNGRYHKTEIEKIVDQRDHEVNNLRFVNQMITEAHIAPTELKEMSRRGNWVKKWLRDI